MRSPGTEPQITVLAIDRITEVCRLHRSPDIDRFPQQSHVDNGRAHERVLLSPPFAPQEAAPAYLVRVPKILITPFPEILITFP